MAAPQAASELWSKELVYEYAGLTPLCDESIPLFENVTTVRIPSRNSKNLPLSPQSEVDATNGSTTPTLEGVSPAY